MPTLLEALQSVDKSCPEPAQLHAFCEDACLGWIDKYDDHKFQTRVQTYWVHKEYDEHEMSYGGLAAVYMDNELIGLRWNAWAGDPYTFQFITKEGCEKIRAWALECVERQSVVNQWLIWESELSKELSEGQYQ